MRPVPVARPSPALVGAESRTVKVSVGSEAWSPATATLTVTECAPAGIRAVPWARVKSEPVAAVPAAVA